MPQVTKVTHCYFIYLHKVDGVFPPLSAPLTIMKGGYPYNQDATNFILTGSTNLFGLTTNALNIRVTGVLMTHRYNTGSRLAQ
jgi:hypothetical protein